MFGSKSHQSSTNKSPSEGSFFQPQQTAPVGVYRSPVTPTTGTTTPPTEKETKPDLFAGFVADQLKAQLANDKLKAHFKKLGETLFKLYLESEKTASQTPHPAQDMLDALRLEQAGRAFEDAAQKILDDPEFKGMRTEIITHVRDNPALALAAAIAGLGAAYLANVPLKADASTKLGKSGVSIGGGGDLGKVQSPEFKSASVYAKFAQKYFESKVSGQVDRKAGEGGKPDDYTGTAALDMKVGDKLLGLTGRFVLDSKGKMTFDGGVGSTFSLGGARTMRLTADVAQDFAKDLTTLKPGLNLTIPMREKQQFEFNLGGSYVVQQQKGGITGNLTYKNGAWFIKMTGSWQPQTGVAGAALLGVTLP
jgi:hypothetical protein